MQVGAVFGRGPVTADIRGRAVNRPAPGRYPPHVSGIEAVTEPGPHIVNRTERYIGFPGDLPHRGVRAGGKVFRGTFPALDGRHRAPLPIAAKALLKIPDLAVRMVPEAGDRLGAESGSGRHGPVRPVPVPFQDPRRASDPVGS